MVITDKGGRLENGSLIAALALVLLTMPPSSSAETKTTSNYMPAPRGGQWTVQTTVTFKAPSPPLERTCSSTVNHAAKEKVSLNQRIAPEVKMESNKTDGKHAVLNTGEIKQASVKNEIASSALPLTVPPTTDRSDYTYYDGVGYYKLHKTKKNWLEAKKTCEEEGAYLAIINAKEEEGAIVNLTSPSIMMYDNVFIGFHDRDSEGQFVTVLGDPLDSVDYVNWAIGQPSDSDGEQNCGTVVGTGEINDFFCDERLYFLCELPQ